MKMMSIYMATTATLGIAATALIMGVGSSVSAQVCEPLEVVNGEGTTEVTKTVSLPGALLIDSNWNTDFAVDSPQAYDYFVVNFLSQSSDSYDIDVNLKYPDDSFDTVYSTRDRVFNQGEAATIRGESRFETSPYQVNLRVGGLNAEGNTYTASVVGCR